ALALLLAGTGLLAEAAVPPARVASLNLCSDILLLELLDDARIASLTHLARDPDLSPLHARAASLPGNHGNAEELIVAAPDLVVTAGPAPPLAARLLARAGIPLLALPHAETFAAYADNLRQLARVLGTEPRARALLATLWQGLGARQPPAPSATAPRALIYQPNGYTPGTRTLASELLRRAGLRDVADELGLPGGGFVTLEHLLVAAPDVIVFPVRHDSGSSLAETLLDHPALAALRRGPHAPHTVAISPALWTCAGTHGLRAVARLAQALP
ncbi:MAG: ABC transporter substrate-binding protein, partial [Gammaproteobacteria bacterium]